MDDDTKADAPLTPDEERALREAWPRTAEALRSMAQRANTARGASWEHGAWCATHLLNAVSAVGHLLATLHEVRAERDAGERTRDDMATAIERLASELERPEDVRLRDVSDVMRGTLEHLGPSLSGRVDALLTERDEWIERAGEAERALDAAWQATGVASTVRELTTLADVVTTLRESAAELRRERDEARARVGLLRQRLLSSDLPMVGRLAMLAALGGGQ